MIDFKELLEEDILQAEEMLYSTIKYLKEYNYDNELTVIRKENKKTDIFMSGFMDVYSSIFYLDEEKLNRDEFEFMEDLSVLITNLKFIKYKLKRQQDIDPMYEKGHIIAFNIISPLIYYYEHMSPVLKEFSEKSNKFDT